jgi:hypothetical protein
MKNGYVPYKYNEPRQGVAQLCCGLRVWKSEYPAKRQRRRMVSRVFLHTLELVWHGRKSKTLVLRVKDNRKQEQCTYNFKDLIIKLDMKFSGGTDLNPSLTNSFPVFSSRGPRLNSHDLGLVN